MGLPIPVRGLGLGDRMKALEQFGVNRLVHAAIVGVVKDMLPETQRSWPAPASGPCCPPHGPDPPFAHTTRPIGVGCKLCGGNARS
ncbi:hypothetical protein [Streptomyces sp. NPDC091268]|uniref:hypothetical protein n=1 Tax=Streptomyces sp. NPDC091268 TaxID=3365979 RepID=UPI00380A5820